MGRTGPRSLSSLGYDDLLFNGVDGADHDQFQVASYDGN